MLVRRVQKKGEFYWRHGGVFLGEALAQQTIGLEPMDERYYRVYFITVPLGIFDSNTFKMLSRRQHNKVLKQFAELAPTVPFAPLRGLWVPARNR